MLSRKTKLLLDKLDGSRSLSYQLCFLFIIRPLTLLLLFPWLALSFLIKAPLPFYLTPTRTLARALVAVHRHRPKSWEKVQKALHKGAAPHRCIQTKWWRDEDMYYNPLHLAVVQEDMEVCQLLLDKGVDVNECAPGICDVTPLLLAMDRKNLPLCLFLLDKGATPDLTCLLKAIAESNFEMCSLLLTHPSLPKDLLSKENHVLLLTFVMSPARTKEVLELLLKYGLDINQEVPNPLLITTLHLYASSQDPFGFHPHPEALSGWELIECLLQKGANMHVRNSKGFSAREVAINHELDILPLLDAFDIKNNLQDGLPEALHTEKKARRL